VKVYHDKVIIRHRLVSGSFDVFDDDFTKKVSLICKFSD